MKRLSRLHVPAVRDLLGLFALLAALGLLAVVSEQWIDSVAVGRSHLLIWLLTALAAVLGSLLWLTGVRARRRAAELAQRTEELRQRNEVLRQEVQAREALQRELQDSQHNLKAVLDAAFEAIITIDTRGTMLTVNRAAVEMFGYTALEMLGSNVSMLMPDPYRSQHDGFIRRHVETGQKHIIGRLREVLGRRATGEIFPMDLAVERIATDHGVLFVGSIIDISARKHAETELRRHHDELQQTVEQRTRELRLAKEAAERANAATTEFMANVTHELRTPIHAILSFADLGHKRIATAPAEKLGSYFDRIHEGGERLLGFVNDILDLAKLESRSAALQCEPFDLCALVQGVVDEMEGLFTARNISVTLAQAPQPVFGDTSKIMQVVRNLLSNAARFTRPDSRISIDFADARLRDGRRAGDAGERDAVDLRISDQGVGIPEAELETVFDKFVQSSKTRTGAGGTGLGLAICREIVELHGGVIYAANNPEGGAIITVVLPRPAA